MKSDLRQIVEVLSRHGVEFIVIGGQAETIYGSPRVTFGSDCLTDPSPSHEVP